MACGSRTQSVLSNFRIHLLCVLTIILPCVDSYIKAEDPSNFPEVIEIANHAGKHDDLVRFLQMARKTP